MNGEGTKKEEKKRTKNQRKPPGNRSKINTFRTWHIYYTIQSMEKSTRIKGEESIRSSKSLGLTIVPQAFESTLKPLQDPSIPNTNPVHLPIVRVEEEAPVVR